MAERNSWAVYEDPSGVVTTEDARIGVGALATTTTTVANARSGWLPHPSEQGQVTASSTPDEFVHVSPLQRVTQSSRGNGPYIQTVDTQIDIDVLSTPADSTNDRYDLIVAQQSDFAYGDSDSQFVIRHVVGTAASSPSDPTVDGSSDYYELARVVVRAGATSIQSSDITDLRPPESTVAAGGVLPVADASERDAVASPHDGMAVWRRDREWMEGYTGSAWRALGGPLVVSSESDLSAISAPYTGQMVQALNEGAVYRWNGSSWVVVQFVAAGHGFARYQQTTAQTVSSGSSTERMELDTAMNECPEVTQFGVTDFTFNVPGVWCIDASVRYAGNSGGGERWGAIADAQNLGYTYGNDAVFPGSSPGSVGWTATRRFGAGDSVAIHLFQNSGSDIPTEPVSESCTVTLSFVGP
ncbi:hypothetical protein SAMN04487905_10617 [Actinopolyspora xinjiangensis]|uniref:Uncharacterized protein n=1 Tax=Actinopolyspora xinjiangensis TaxID=405564 RepID=A0A1H0U2V2_9ACTN|nr:hypothetical protein [Actinopolyspora xinjiangensis]SDP60597.1 hypothetical protein SAMN04487905_10617 [Actinopolyspora xinjiangensis]